MPEEAPDELAELIDFLSDSRQQLRQQAAEIVQGLSGSDDGVRQKSHAEAKPAATALVNLCQDPRVVTVVLAKGGVERVMERVREAEAAPIRGLLVMLLANMVQDEAGARQFLQEGRGELEGFHLGTLLRMAHVAPAEMPHAATVAANVTAAAPLGRRLVASKDLDLAPALVALMKCPDRDARAGAARALRNCAADAERLAEVAALPGVIDAALRLVDGESPKELENDVRAAAAEMIAALSKAEEGRAALWAANAPEKLRKGYEYEEDRDVCAAMEATIALLMAQGREEEDAGGAGVDISTEGGMVMFDK